MSLTPTYSLLSTQVPLPQVPPSVLDVADKVPVVSEAYVSGMAPDFLGIGNRNAVRQDLVGRFGGGAYGVLHGLELDGSGLTLSISPGQAMIDGPVPQDVPASSYSLAMSDGVFNRVWFSRGGTPDKTAGDLANPGGPPDQDKPWVFLGTVPTSGSIQGVDYSGRPTVVGSQMLVRTADAGEPEWEPPASIRFWQRCQTASESDDEARLYFWDGEQFHSLASGLDLALEELLADVALLRRDHDDLERRFLRLEGQMLRTIPSLVPPTNRRTDAQRALALGV